MTDGAYKILYLPHLLIPTDKIIIIHKENTEYTHAALPVNRWHNENYEWTAVNIGFYKVKIIELTILPGGISVMVEI